MSDAQVDAEAQAAYLAQVQVTLHAIQAYALAKGEDRRARRAAMRAEIDTLNALRDVCNRVAKP